MKAEASTAADTTNKLTGRVLETLAYFDIFEYPLSADDIHRFLHRDASMADTVSAIQDLIAARAIFQHGQFYSLRPDPELAKRRIKGSERANKLLPKAFSIGRFLYGFPFVRGVAISGSLSKNYIVGKADFDFFIITKENRLWIARTLMHAFKKLTYLAGSQHLFCMNFFIAENALAFEERNPYIATEIATLLPVAGDGPQAFFLANAWVNRSFPNYAPSAHGIFRKESWLKKILEGMLKGKRGDNLDNYFLGVTSRRWARKEAKGNRNMKGKIMSLQTSKNVARSNPESFQERIVGSYNAKVAELQNKWPQLF